MYIFQSEKVIKLRFWLKSNLADLNPLDCHVWGAILGRYTCQNRPTLPSWRVPCCRHDLPQWFIDKGILSLRKKLRSCVAAAGGHFEHSV